ncbi:metallophosphoesterase [Archangium lipolyticum]|uniref:metallophosphoesterase n=1 Tax=Archangium lipolyticum TaxID=2970465 RepID=UPI002149C4B6|nr:metallophosphoesterase [Archangium lipolyticum]
MVPLRFVIFFGMLSLVVVSGHIYLYRRLFRDTAAHRAWRRAGVGVMAVLASAILGSRVLTHFFPSTPTFAFANLGWYWMGTATYLLLAVLSLGGVRKLSGWLERRRAGKVEPAPVSEERRQFLARASAGAALAATGGMASYGVWRAFTPPVVNEVAVRLPGLPKALDGFTIVQLSDVHVGPLIQRRFMDAVVAQTNGLKGDLVCITGDLVDGSVEELGFAAGALRNLRSRYGTYFCTGNHEYYSGDEEWTEALTRMGMTVLRNRHVPIGEPGASFDLVGVDDWGAQRSGYPRARSYDLAAATAGRDPSRAAVLLAHQPSGWRELAQKAGMGLQLSGHTHGGQFFPFNLVVSAIWEHPAGLFREGDSHLYVSRGTGFWGPPLRVAAPPEIVKVTLLA